MTKPRRDGMYLLLLGIAVFVLFGVALRFTATDSMADFKNSYYGARCLLHHCDPYNQSELLNYYRTQFEQMESIQERPAASLSVYLPPIFLFTAPFAILPLGLASALWMSLTAVSLILAAVLTWDRAADNLPIPSGALVGFLIANGAIVMANGNAAGIVEGLCIISVCCFLKNRFVLAGVLCLAISLALKPHDVGLVWLYFLLAGGICRKRAVQALGITVVLGLVAVLWVSRVAPQWTSELRTNLTAISSRGATNDPGPTGLTSKTHTMEEIIDLQAVVSVFRDDPRVYNTTAYLICGALIFVWSFWTLKRGYSEAGAWFALAAIAPITMLVTYHRAYDARLLLLTVPAGCMLWAEGHLSGRVALLINSVAFVITGEVPLAILNHVTKSLSPNPSSFVGQMEMVFFMRPASLILLATGAFYLWAYVRGEGVYWEKHSKKVIGAPASHSASSGAPSGAR